MTRIWDQPTPIVALLAACTCLYLASPAKAEECSDPCTVTATVPDIHLVDTSLTGTTDDWEIRTEAGLLRMGRLAGNQQLFTLEIGAAANTLHIDQEERIGINTFVPAEELQINSTIPGILLNDISSGAGQADIRVLDDTLAVRGNAAHNIVSIDTRAAGIALIVSEAGDVAIGNGIPSAKLHVHGDARVEGDVALGSSRTLKTAFDAVDPAEVLAKLADLPIASWRYKTEEDSERHIGPFAEDFQRLFGLGDGETISVIDAQGVALAAIQGVDGRLDREVAGLRARIASLTETNLRLASENADLRDRLETIEEVLGHLGAALSRHRQEPSE